MTHRILAIDPGPEKSAWIIIERDGHIGNGAISGNHDVLGLFDGFGGTVVIEMVQSFGMPVGAEVFTTVWWTGRFWERAVLEPCCVVGLHRKEIVTHLCNSAKAKDSNVRQALLDRFGGKQTLKKKEGVPRWVAKDLWSALAIAVTAQDKGLIGGSI